MNMKRLDIFKRCMEYGSGNIFINKLFRTYTTEVEVAQTTTSKPTINWDQARPFNEMPFIHPFRTYLNFLPGGRYANKDINQITKGFLIDGGGIVHIGGTFGKKSIVMTENPDDFEAVFRTEGVWPIRTSFEIINYHRTVTRKDYYGDHRGLLSSQGKHWFEFRRAVNPILIHPKNIKVYIPDLANISQEFVDRIKVVRDPVTLEVPNNFKDEISCFILESVGVVILDYQLGLLRGINPDGKIFFNKLQRFFDLSAELEIKFSIWRTIETPKLKEALKILDYCNEFTEPYMQRTLQRLDQSPELRNEDKRGLLAKLVATDRKLAVTMATETILSAVDTSTSAFAALLLLLATNPDKQEKLREETLRILPNKDSPINADTLRNLPYLRACLKESLRIYPVNQSNLRTTQEDLVLSGYQVPRDTDVVMVNLNVFEDPAYFSRPKEFIPERWLRESEKSIGCPYETATKTNHPFGFLPFGYGSRSCIGRRILELEVDVAITRLIRNFKIEFNYPFDNPFKINQINTPRIPLKFKFTDLDY